MSSFTLSRKDITTYMLRDQIDEEMRSHIYNAADALNKLGLWEWVKTFEPAHGFMFIKDDEIIHKLSQEIESANHSGLTFAMTFRYLQKIAKELIKDMEHKYCCICILDFDEDTNTDNVTLECYHTFHKNCISQVFTTCPLCRSDTIPDSLKSKKII
jgi:hypothetical protein